MSIVAFAHVWDLAPDDLTPAQLLALLALADSCNPDDLTLAALNVKAFAHDIRCSEEEAMAIIRVLIDRELLAAYQRNQHQILMVRDFRQSGMPGVIMTDTGRYKMAEFNPQRLRGDILIAPDEQMTLEG